MAANGNSARMSYMMQGKNQQGVMNTQNHGGVGNTPNAGITGARFGGGSFFSGNRVNGPQVPQGRNNSHMGARGGPVSYSFTV
ncbi:hypothetical protein BRADI_3g14976v3 [Brachypodium distachyon]|uniref:Uncharacterized protein n=1 Tax=Brachypodium distachyon TaxID=15368 RepID=I1I0X5_BRADI|nr:hypothetical protein BRADI_3g14976v3 [Brachypodium distachyon]